MIRKIGQDLDQLGITWDYEEGDIITHAIVVMHVENPDDGTSSLVYECSEGMESLIAEGMLSRAMKVHDRIVSGLYGED